MADRYILCIWCQTRNHPERFDCCYWCQRIQKDGYDLALDDYLDQDPNRTGHSFHQGAERMFEAGVIHERPPLLYQQKCEYQGIWTRAGCNEDALTGSDFCHAHQQQGRTLRIRNVLAIIFVVIIGGSCGLCGVLMVASS